VEQVAVAGEGFLAAYVDPVGAWDQGDIVAGVYFAADDAAHPAVLVTPACDIAQEKVDLWTFVRVFPELEVAAAVIASELQGKTATELTKKQRESACKRLGELLGQRYQRYHWLPPWSGGGPGHVADFTWVTAMPVEEIKRGSQRLARLKSSWREELPARYASYMARVGTEDFERTAVDDYIAQLLQRVLEAP
jgi:hypothetical protein